MDEKWLQGNFLGLLILVLILCINIMIELHLSWRVGKAAIVLHACVNFLSVWWDSNQRLSTGWQSVAPCDLRRSSSCPVPNGSGYRSALFMVVSPHEESRGDLFTALRVGMEGKLAHRKIRLGAVIDQSKWPMNDAATRELKRRYGTAFMQPTAHSYYFGHKRHASTWLVGFKKLQVRLRTLQYCQMIFYNGREFVVMHIFTYKLGSGFWKTSLSTQDLIWTVSHHLLI